MKVLAVLFFLIFSNIQAGCQSAFLLSGGVYKQYKLKEDYTIILEFLQHEPNSLLYETLQHIILNVENFDNLQEASAAGDQHCIFLYRKKETEKKARNHKRRPAYKR